MPRKDTLTKVNNVATKQPLSSLSSPILQQHTTAPTSALSQNINTSLHQLPPNSSPPLNSSKSLTTSNRSPTLSSHTLTPPSPIDSSFEWILKQRRPYPFSTEVSLESGLEFKKLKVFEIEGVVDDCYLRADAYAHTINVRITAKDIDDIKTVVRSAPGHLEPGFRWPFNNQVVKFTSKDSKEKLAQDFEPILDGRGIQDWKRYVGNLGDLTSDHVVEGSKVVIEYTPVPYSGKKPNRNDDGFPSGCTLKLHSITVLGMSDQRPALDTSSPSKRRRLVYS